MKTDIIDELGELAMGSRLKRLSDYIMREGKEVYVSHGIDFEPRWFPIFYLLSREPSLTVVSIADRLGITHSAVSQTVKEMTRMGIILTKNHKSDKRKKSLSLSTKGETLLVKMEPLWNDIATSFNNIVREHQNHLVSALQEMEDSFEQISFSERVHQVRNERLQNEVEIVGYKPEYAKYFESLNVEWLEKYFHVEEYDKKVLSNPEDYIINKGGDILFAKLNGEIIGTCALLKFPDDEYELTKMAVTEKAQGHQAGKKLGQAIIQRAKELNAKKVFLESNKILTPALTLYRRLGFVNAYRDFGKSMYERANVYMELVL